MKGAYLVAHQPDLFQIVSRVLVDRGAVSDPAGGITQYTDPRGRLFTAEADPGPEFDYRDPPFIAAAAGQPQPDMSTVTAISVDCRWEDLFVQLCADIAAAAPGPVWVLDGDGVIWPAAAVDPRRLRL